MVSMCRRVLALVFPVLALAGLAGCNRSQGVVYQESASDDKPTAEKVVRGVADTGDGGETKKGEEEGFRFPNDKGGEVLARVLAPSVDVRAVRVQKPRRQTAPASLEAPSLALPPAQPAMPRVALEWKRPTLLPRLVIDETLGGGAEPGLPEALAFATGAKTRDAGVDVNQPPPLPRLGQPVPDRASLEDPTTEASMSAAIAAKVPLRTRPAPFQRLSIPDPFENYIAVPKSALPPEPAEPPLGPARNPKP